MRLTVLEGDPGERIAPGARYDVYLDGALVPHVFTADDDKGEVLAADVDERGHMQVDEAGTGVKTKTLYGRVEIKRIN
ncbi:hypothetical protein ACT7V1_004152 [Salmonella enterica subsp. enterica]|nr:hypothetical protein [Salmonella enterica]EJI5362927.1 hypothetical protein [Salmonella enterica]ELX5323364.1 hypothetical protein [Salmonella enterica]